MKRILLYLLLLSSCIAGAQAIVVPDANFKAKLLAANTTNNIAKDSSGDSIEIDTNYDGVISQEEAQEVRELYIATSGITSLSGIEYFTNLRILDFSHNNITTFDATPLEDLRSLTCTSNGMTSLLVNDLSHLEVLDFGSNNVAAINLTGLDSLKELTTYFNPAISSLDLSGLEYLEMLNCNANNLSVLDVSMLVNLSSINCSNNNLTTLDLSANVNLESASFFANELVTIFLKNGKNESFDPANWIENTTLEYICADESQIEALLDQTGMLSNVQINSYCSYEPGGVYNRIVGTIRFDANDNGYGGDDYAIPSFRLKINEGGYEDTIFTRADGTYVFYVGTGNYTITPMFENDYFIAVPVTSAYVNFPVLTGVQETRDFSIKSNGTVHNDVEVVMVPVTNARPGFDAVYKMVYKNKGNQVIASGDVTCYWDSSRLGYVDVSEPISGMGPDTYTWNYFDLKPFESREIEMTLSVNSPTDTPAVNIGDVLDFNVSINPGTDDMPGDNSFDFNQVVVGAFDPNNIVCVEGSTVSPDNIGEYLHYIVNFENTGTAPANFVVVQMDIDPDQFDLTTFSLINSSANTTVRTTGNRVEIRFDNIMMAVDGNGNLLYKIKSRNGLLAGAAVSSRANIYFDYNFPVETDPAITTFGILGLDDFDKDNSVTVYPNPSKDIVTIDTVDNTIKSIQLYDIQGRLLQTGIVNEVSTSVDLSGRASGMYILKVNTEKGIKVEKLIRE